MAMTPRRSFPNEVCTVHSKCGRLCIAVVARADGYHLIDSYALLLSNYLFAPKEPLLHPALVRIRRTGDAASHRSHGR
jgi:hypothetical protein